MKANNQVVIKIIWAGILNVLWALSSLGSTNLLVTSVSGSGPGTLRQAILDSASGDSISFDLSLAGQSIVLTNGSMSITNDLVINPESNRREMAIYGSSTSRIFEVSSNTTVTLRWLNLFDGRASNGGAVYNEGDLSLETCSLINNVADQSGGALYNAGSLSLSNVLFRSNQAMNAGGGLYNVGSIEAFYLTLHSNGVTHVFAEGGGLWNSGTVYLRESISYDNESTYLGGSVFNSVSGYFQMENSQMGPDSALRGGGLYNQGRLEFLHVNLGNCHADLGGGIFHEQGVLELNQSSIAVCSADLLGGGLYNLGTGLVENCTFWGNIAATNGGAVFNQGDLSLLHTTVTSNRAFSGAGIYNEAQLSINNTIVGENFATNLISDIFGDCITQGTNIVQVQGGGVFSDTSRVMSVPPKLKTYGIYGHRIPNFYFYGIPICSLPELDSPAINGGATNALALDQRGFVRYGNAPDIGAVERGTWVVNTVVDENDGSAVGGVSLRDAINEFSTYGYITFDPLLSGQTIVLTNGQLEISDSGGLIDGSMLATNITLSGNHSNGILRVEERDIITGNAELVRIISVNFIEGKASEGGGLHISNRNRSSSIIDCNVVNNQADVGGGIFSGDQAGNLNLIRCAIVSNSALYGGGVFTFLGNLSLRNCTVAGNSMESIGFFADYVGTSFDHCTFIGNSPLDEPGGIIDYFDELEKNNSIFSSSVVTNLEGVLITTNSLVGGSNLFAPLAYYGNRTLIMPPLPGSPVIEGALPSPLLTDQRGAPRISGSFPDIGSVEAVPLESLELEDSDDDGVPDILEPLYGMVVGQDDSMADTDNDGSPDAEELAVMTNPLDPNSVFKILDLEYSTNAMVEVTLLSFPGLDYVLEFDQSPDFSAPLQSPVETATNHTHVMSLPLALEEHLYIRVIQP